MHHLRIVTIIIATLFAAYPVLSGDDHDHHHESKHTAQHGGILAESGHHYLEIVAKDGKLDVYITGDHGTDEVVSKAKATAAVLSQGKKVDVALAPGDGAVLRGTGDFTAAPGTTIVITLTMPDHDPEQVRVKLK